jgi:peroxiredoxin
VSFPKYTKSQAFGIISAAMDDDYRVQPASLPAPVDDGAADHLPGLALPSETLSSTRGGTIELGEATHKLAVVYIYPSTGVPGRPLPEGWDEIPGARGCTPQSCAFRDHVLELAAYGASVLGLSAQDPDEQHEFARREHIPYPLLSDPEFRLAAALRLPTFEADGRRFYRRLTFIARERRIAKVFYPIFPAHRNASQVLSWLAAQPASDPASA